MWPRMAILIRIKNSPLMTHILQVWIALCWVIPHLSESYERAVFPALIPTQTALQVMKETVLLSPVIIWHGQPQSVAPWTISSSPQPWRKRLKALHPHNLRSAPFPHTFYQEIKLCSWFAYKLHSLLLAVKVFAFRPVIWQKTTCLQSTSSL